MAEARHHSNTPEQYEVTREPTNPPNDVVQPEVGRATRWAFLFPIVILAIIAGLLWVYYTGQPPQLRSAEDTGDRAGVVGTSGQETPGGIDPNPKFDRTESELKYRGATSSPRSDYNTLRSK